MQRAFRLRFNIQPPTRKRICLWNHQFEQIGCLCKGKSSGRPSVSEENVRRIQESFDRSPRKSQPVERAENLEYRNRLSGACWDAVYCLIESIFVNHRVFSNILKPVTLHNYLPITPCIFQYSQTCHSS